MKVALTLVSLSASILFVTAKDLREVSSKVSAAAEKCQKEHKVDQAVMDDFFKQKKIPSDSNGKCMLDCFMKEMKYIKDGKYDIDAIKAANKLKWSNEKEADTANEIAEKCINEPTLNAIKDECEKAFKLTTCWLEKAKEAKLPHPSHEKV